MNEQAHRRLLDMLAGWAKYVSKCAESEEPHPGVTKEAYEREAEAISALYQRAAGDDDWRRFLSDAIPFLIEYGVE